MLESACPSVSRLVLWVGGRLVARPGVGRMISAAAAAAAAANAAAHSSGKKAAQVQLQAELGTNEEWEKFIHKDGLLVVDVYSEWCGPCLGMVGNLKKLKVEVGGDNLHLAVAKSDTIDCLKRFRNKSEPTWMFIAGGKLLKVMVGADAPRLTRLILEELKNEEEVQRGERTRPDIEPHQLTPQEEEVAAAEARAAEERRLREKAAAQAAREARRVARADLLEPYIKDVCPVLLWPHAHKHLKKISDLLEPNGIIVADKYPVIVSKEAQTALWEGLTPEEREPLLASTGPLAERPSLAVLLRRAPNAELPSDLVETIYRVLCVDKRGPEGNEKTSEEEARGEGGCRGLYVPADRLQRAAAIDVLYSKLVSSAVEPPAPETPPHVAVMFGAWQRREVLAVCSRHPKDILQLGFFADQDLQTPKNLARDLARYEQRPEKDYSDTLVLMVARRGAGVDNPEGTTCPHDEVLKELTSLGALHVSEDTVIGAEECARFFPPGYGVPEVKPQAKPKKKKSKKRGDTGKDESSETPTVPTGASSEVAGEAPVTAEGAEGAAGEGGEGGEGEAAPHDSEEEEENQDETTEDKATSPIPDAPAT